MCALRRGYAGCGFTARNVHLPHPTTLPECEAAVLAKVRPDLGRKVQILLGIPAFHEDHMGLARDDSLDVPTVSSDFTTQGEIAIDLLRTGRPVFMEKPTALCSVPPPGGGSVPHVSGANPVRRHRHQLTEPRGKPILAPVLCAVPGPRGGIGIHSRLRACARMGMSVRVRPGAPAAQLPFPESD